MRVFANRLVAALLSTGLGWQVSGTAAESSVGETYRPCASDSAAYADAAGQIQVIDQQIRALKPENDHRAANDALIALLDHDCMKFAIASKDDLRAEAAPALVDFWTRIGRSWLQGMLGLAEYRNQYFAGPMRKVMASKTRPDFPVPSLLCPLDDEACGQETQGWWQRAETFFKLDEDHTVFSAVEDFHIDHIVNKEECRTRALVKPALDQYENWVLCIHAIPMLRYAMPLGRVKAPTTGWLIMRLQSGGSSSCDRVGVFSLATGSAYRGEACDVLPPVAGKQNRAVKITRGMIFADNLRELVWYDLQRNHVIPGYSQLYNVGPNSFDVPEELPLLKVRGGPSSPPQNSLVRTLALVSSGSLSQDWTLVNETGKAVTKGNLVWTPSFVRPGYNASITYAMELWEIAESSYIEGCPRENPPADIDSSQWAPAEIELLAGIQKMAQTGCTSKH